MNQDAIREFLLDHSRSSLNGRFPSEAHFTAKMTNPLCGDHVELRILSRDSMISDIGFKAGACAICTASASVMTEFVKGKTFNHVLKLGDTLENTLTENMTTPWPAELNHFVSFEHLKVNPARRMCALLPWVVLRKALKMSGVKS